MKFNHFFVILPFFTHRFFGVFSTQSNKNDLEKSPKINIDVIGDRTKEFRLWVSLDQKPFPEYLFRRNPIMGYAINNKNVVA